MGDRGEHVPAVVKISVVYCKFYITLIYDISD